MMFIVRQKISRPQQIEGRNCIFHSINIYYSEMNPLAKNNVANLYNV